MTNVDNNSGGMVSQILRGSIKGLFFSVLCILIFALAISFFNLSSTVIKPINQFIKMLCIFTACLVSVKHNKGILKGGLIGGFITILTYIFFGIIASDVSIDLGMLIDIIFGIIMGGISGVIAVNLSKN